MRIVCCLKSKVNGVLRPFTLLSVIILHTLFFISEVHAQKENAAFYIYQNDGHFDGFFYEEVTKISYSKLDTLGVEHDDYVSQEIITRDSTYRIMLSAIDSVSFVQPEIKFNPNLRDMRKEGMLEYLTAMNFENMTLSFSATMPENLRPKKGDVLVDFDTTEGFGGKAVSVNTTGGNIEVSCDTIGFRDVFLQFITVEQQDKDENGQLIRRRIAGMPDACIDNRALLYAPYREKGEFSGNIFNFAISGHVTVLDSSEVQITIDANFNSALTVKGSYNIPLVGAYYIGLTFQNDIDVGLGVTVDGTIKKMKERETPFKASVPIPAACPIFELRSVPGLFMKGEAHVKFGADLVRYRKRVWHKLEFHNSWLPSFNFGNEQLPELDDPIEDPSAREVALELNGMFMFGIHGPLELGINSWLKKVIDASFGVHTYIGPKVTAALNVSLSNMYNDGVSIYNAFKDSKATIQPCAVDIEAKAQAKTWFSGKKEIVLSDGSLNFMGDIEVYVFPEFKLDVVTEEMGYPEAKEGRVLTTVTPSRNLFYPVNVGYGIYKGNEMIDCFFASEIENLGLPRYWQFSKEWKEKKSFEHKCYLKSGKYQVKPLFQLAGFDIEASPVKEILVPGTYLDVSSDSLYITDQGTIQEPIIVDSNCDNIKALVNSNNHNVLDTRVVLNPIGENMWKLTYKGRKNYDFMVDYKNTFWLFGERTVEGKVVEIEKSMDVHFLPNTTNFPKTMVVELTDKSDYPNTYGVKMSDVPVVAMLNGNALHVSCLGNVPTSDGYVVYDISFDLKWGPDVPTGPSGPGVKQYLVANSRVNATQYFNDDPGRTRDYHYTIDGQYTSIRETNGKHYMWIYDMSSSRDVNMSLDF